MSDIQEGGSANKKLPVTLLSGFLGAGKTTLLKHILENKQGLKCAIIVNDMAAVNIDASLVAGGGMVQREEKMVKMQNGCICCTLREDLLEEIAKLAQDGQFDYLIIESTGISEPMQVAETFSFDNEELGIASLSDTAMLDTCVTVIDTVNFKSILDSVDTVSYAESQREDVTASEEIAEEDERNLADLLVDQIEFANVIILNKTDMCSPDELSFVQNFVGKLNPEAKVLLSTFCNVPLESIINTGLFDLEKASEAPGWLQQMRYDVNPETEEYGVSSFVYRARRPFNPCLISEFMKKHFVLICMSADEDAEAGDSSEESKLEEAEKERRETLQKRDAVLSASAAKFGRILRSKGFLWIAHDSNLKVAWSHAGVLLTVGPEGPWFATMDFSDWPEEAQAEIKQAFEGEFGDRRQEIVFIGSELNQEAITKELDACLLSDEQMSLGMEAWTTAFDHDWPNWPVPDEDDEEDHGHAH